LGAFLCSVFTSVGVVSSLLAAFINDKQLPDYSPVALAGTNSLLANRLAESAESASKKAAKLRTDIAKLSTDIERHRKYYNGLSGEGRKEEGEKNKKEIADIIFEKLNAKPDGNDSDIFGYAIAPMLLLRGSNDGLTVDGILRCMNEQEASRAKFHAESAAAKKTDSDSDNEGPAYLNYMGPLPSMDFSDS
jgi:hypothetical protein